ncbi:SDR family NAD(P)-dependent oxidoreductase [Actinotalea sp. BY-33]|uniref:SDR family NAD(P)-dependent oxidoreductase n=1 Tax=Actinotalea soli TaxID=2819234 RepID=A0A939LQA9_9CELL|nr:SDR family NAD(P)-dependent oxidoreductase [Actinotalea soli]MBO1752054.1 SDR family NAD(P)-dependent oxidoreductase [Actinotalea soli]
MDINDSTVFIPGATSGIGLALALALHDAGSTVVVGGRRTELLEQIAAEHPGLGTVHVDTTDPASIQVAAEEVIARWPGLDTLVTMAGVMQAEDWHHPDGFLASAERTITTNVLGPVRLIAAFLEHLRSRPAATIMTVSSGLAFVPLRVTPSYNASKAAIHMLSESLRLQLADTAVRVVELVPPSVQTDLMPGQATNENAMPLAEFIAEVMTILREQPEAPEVLVEHVKLLRFGEARGDYPQVVAAVNASDPHGR